MDIELTQRHRQIIAIVRDRGPITGEKIAEELSLTRATLRPDLTVLTMAGYLDARPRVGYFYAGNPSADLLSRLLRGHLVRDYKSVPVVVQGDATAYDAVVAMFLEDVGTLFVVRESGILTGVLSRKDLLKVAMGQPNLREVPVSIAMTRMPNIVTVEMSDTMYDAAKKLVDMQVDSLPVVRPAAGDRGLEVVGRVTKTTVTRLFVELGSHWSV